MNSGIKAETIDNKVFYFYTQIQGEVESSMILMGYGNNQYWLQYFENIPEPSVSFFEEE